MLILRSARRHGISDEDIRHAFRNPVRVYPEDDDLIMLVGPSRDSTLLEIGVVDGATGPVVVHAMRARAKYLR